jgi:hypothetical protein
MPTLQVRDETLDGRPTEGGGMTLSLDDLAETVTVRELIRARVYQEVDDHNRRVRQANADRVPFSGLVTPTETEQRLNGPGTGKASAKEVDWRKQFDAACEAFKMNGFLVLVDDRQVSDLEDEITLRPETDVAFVKLTMLVGG